MLHLGAEGWGFALRVYVLGFHFDVFEVGEGSLSAIGKIVFGYVRFATLSIATFFGGFFVFIIYGAVVHFVVFVDQFLS